MSGRIDGEYLQGGVGELQAIGLVRVMIEEHDYPRAKAFLDEWESTQVQTATPRDMQSTNRIGFLIIGFLCGIVAMAILNQTPVTEDGIDFNGDGVLDETWTYVNYAIARSEVDRNLDGKVDLISKFNRQGLLQSSQADDNFDGDFETEISYKNNNPASLQSDTSGDGVVDLSLSFNHGVLETATFLDRFSKKPVKVQYFDPFKVKKAEVDTNGDGRLDTVYEYDVFEEVTNKYDK